MLRLPGAMVRSGGGNVSIGGVSGPAIWVPRAAWEPDWEPPPDE